MKTQNSWQEKTLQDIAFVDSGQGAPQGEKWYNGNEIFVKAGDLNYLANGKYVGDQCKRVGKDAVLHYRLKKYPKNAIVFPKSGMSIKTDNIALLKYESFVVNHLAVVSPKKDDEILSKYLYYFLKQKKVSNLSLNAGYPSIRLSDINKVRIRIPQEPYLSRIVSNLEEAEQLQQWRKESDKLTNEYLNSVFTEMFANPYSNFNGFEEKGLLEIFDITTGKLDSNASKIDGKFPFFTCAQETFRINSFSFDCEALLLSGNNAAGIFSVKHYKGKFDAYQRTYVLTSKNKNNSYRYFQILLEKKLEELKVKSIGTNTKYLTMGILEKIKLMVPPTELQKRFEPFSEQIQKLVEFQKNSAKQIDILSNALIKNIFKGDLMC